MKSNTPVDKVMIQSNTQKALSGNEFQNSVFNKIFQIVGNTAILKNKVAYNDVEIVYRKNNGIRHRNRFRSLGSFISYVFRLKDMAVNLVEQLGG